MLYIIIDEMSMVGRKMFGQVDRRLRLRQVFPHRWVIVSATMHIMPLDVCHAELSSCLVCAYGWLGLQSRTCLYTTVSSTELSDLGSANYKSFDRAVVLWDRQEKIPIKNCSATCCSDCQFTIDDWRHLIGQTPAEVRDTTPFPYASIL